MLGRYIRDGELIKDNAAGALPCACQELIDRRIAKLSIMGWILLGIALLRGVARVDVQSPGHKLKSNGPVK